MLKTMLPSINAQNSTITIIKLMSTRQNK